MPSIMSDLFLLNINVFYRTERFKYSFKSMLLNPHVVVISP